LKVANERKKAREAELAGLGAAANVASLDAAKMAKELRAKVADVTTLLGENVAQARAMLRKILVGKIVCSPVRRAGRSGLMFEGRVSLARLLPATVLSDEVLNSWRGQPIASNDADDGSLTVGSSRGTSSSPW
jgi:hypothetical protein